MTTATSRAHNGLEAVRAMALHGEEQRRLTEIERQLAEENPRLAQRLAELRPMRIPGVVLAAFGGLVSIVVGLFVLVAAAQLHVAVLMIFGTLLVSGVPTLLLWRTLLHRLR